MLQSPQQHYARLAGLLRRITESPEASRELMRWGLSLDPDIHRVRAAGGRALSTPGSEAVAAPRWHRGCRGFLLASDPGPSPARGEDQPAAQLLRPRREPELEQGGDARSLHLGGEPPGSALTTAALGLKTGVGLRSAGVPAAPLPSELLGAETLPVFVLACCFSRVFRGRLEVRGRGACFPSSWSG